MGTALLLLFVFAGPVRGLLQQTTPTQAEDVECEVRARFLRDRLLSSMERLSLHSAANPDSDRQFSNLLRETHEVCAQTHPQLVRKLDTIEQLFRDQIERRHLEANAREKLRAMF